MLLILSFSHMYGNKVLETPGFNIGGLWLRVFVQKEAGISPHVWRRIYLHTKHEALNFSMGF